MSVRERKFPRQSLLVSAQALDARYRPTTGELSQSGSRTAETASLNDLACALGDPVLLAAAGAARDDRA